MPLNEINTSTPAGADAANTVDDQLRALKEDVKESFHGNDSGSGAASGYSEHYGQGQHKFPRGDGTVPALPDAPAAGNGGRLFLDTTNGGILRDDGSIWKLLTSRAKFDESSSTVVLTTSYQTLASVSLNVPSGARILAFASAAISMAGLGQTLLKVSSSVDGLLSPGESTIVCGSSVGQIYMQSLIVFLLTPTIGQHTITFEAKEGAGAPAAEALDRCLVAICL